ncbi:MAG TPA: phosphoenolpyruvate carboxylase, partial [Gammaproteobacteria bacterium]|nr:phosphoenolpyruvate carboxylase [Gammaproteobacteria bacterium]
MKQPVPDRVVEFAAKDEGLRDDVNLLGRLVGEVLVEQGGRELFDRVEAVRAAAIGRRERGDGGTLEHELVGLAPAQASELVR